MTISPETIAAVAAIVQEAHPHLSHERAAVAARGMVDGYLAKHQDAAATVSVTWMGDATYKDLVADNVAAYAKTAPALFVAPPNRSSIYAYERDVIAATGARLQPTEQLSLLRKCESLSDEEALAYVGKLSGEAPAKETAPPDTAADLEAAKAIIGENASGQKTRSMFNSVSGDRARRGRDAQAVANYAAQTNLSPADRLSAHRLQQKGRA